jgi:hypothetical protein
LGIGGNIFLTQLICIESAGGDGGGETTVTATVKVFNENSVNDNVLAGKLFVDLMLKALI